MDLTVSPDLDAYYCYAVVLALGLFTAFGQVSRRLTNLPGKWIMVNTWLLFFAYTAVPLGLFWMLDRSNAIHDTSLFAAILIGLGYQQVLSGESASIRPVGELSKFWQPFAAWADHVADRIRNRILRNESLFGERLLMVLRKDPAKLDTLRELAFTHTKDVDGLNTELKEIADAAAILGTAGVLTKTAETLYENLKVSEPETWPFLLFQREITSRANYYWFGLEWRSKTAAIVVATLLIGITVFAVVRLWTPENRGRYYVWRIQKTSNTEQDRFRASQRLLACLNETRNPYPSLTAILRNQGVPVKTAENVLSLIMESRDIASTHQVDVPRLLAESLRTDNPDIRARVHSVLLYLAAERNIDVGPLKDWKPSAKDSTTDIDNMIKQWKQIKLIM